MHSLSRRKETEVAARVGWPTLAPIPALTALNNLNALNWKKWIACVNALILTALIYTHTCMHVKQLLSIQVFKHFTQHLHFVNKKIIDNLKQKLLSVTLSTTVTNSYNYSVFNKNKLKSTDNFGLEDTQWTVVCRLHLDSRKGVMRL